MYQSRETGERRLGAVTSHLVFPLKSTQTIQSTTVAMSEIKGNTTVEFQAAIIIISNIQIRMFVLLVLLAHLLEVLEEAYQPFQLLN